MELKTTNKKSVSIEYKEINETKFAEATEWTNGEGFDVALNDKIISLTHDEFSALCSVGNLLNLE